MKNVYLIMFLFVAMVIQINVAFAKKIAVTTESDGFKKVILKDDGTWAYYENKEVTAYEQFLIIHEPKDIGQNEKLLKCMIKTADPELIGVFEKVSGLLAIVYPKGKNKKALEFVFG